MIRSKAGGASFIWFNVQTLEGFELDDVIMSDVTSYNVWFHFHIILFISCEGKAYIMFQVFLFAALVDITC